MTIPPSRDWTRPYGIPFDRNNLPPDDDVTDTAAWLAAQFDGLAAEAFEIDERANGRPHLSECLLVMAYEGEWDDPSSYHCTCDDFSPEWTIG